MKSPTVASSPRSNYMKVVIVLAMLVVPAILTMRQVRVSAVVDISVPIHRRTAIP